MKTQHAAAAVLVTLSSLASAFPPGARPGPPPNVTFSNGNTIQENQPKPEPAVTEEELGSTRDKFETYRKLTFEGFRYYVKTEETQRILHSQIYQKIRDNTLNERLTVSQARGFVSNLLQIARNNAAVHTDGGTPNDETKKSVQDTLEELSKTIDLALVNQINGDILTPDLNRREWLMDELIHFGAETSLSQARITSLVGRLETLLVTEEQAKQKGSITNTERNKLLETTVDTWKSFLRTFAR